MSVKSLFPCVNVRGEIVDCCGEVIGEYKENIEVNYMQAVGPSYWFINGKQTKHNCSINKLTLLDCRISEKDNICLREWECVCGQRFMTEEKLFKEMIDKARTIFGSDIYLRNKENV